MNKNFHETAPQTEVKMPTEKSTGLVFAAIALIVAFFNLGNTTVMATCVGVALVLTILSLAAPWVLAPLNVAWFRFSLLLHKITNPIIMGLLFVLVIVPAGLIMRLWYDPLRVRKGRNQESYWITENDQKRQPASMNDQF